MKLDAHLLSNPNFILKQLQLISLRQAAPFLTGRIIDIGCGSQPYKRYLACDGYIGIDGEAAMKPDICASATKVPFKDSVFDSALCTEVLEHLAKPDLCLAEIRRVLKPGGYLYLTVPQAWGLHFEPHDYWRFTRYGIEYLLEENGFTVITNKRIGGICSMAGQEIIDALWVCIKKLLSVAGPLWSERLATAILFPLSLLVYVTSRVGDRIENRYTLDWAVVAKK